MPDELHVANGECVSVGSGSFKAQLAEANSKIARLYSDPERFLSSDKKNTYHHDKQLEELRNLQVRSYGCMRD